MRSIELRVLVPETDPARAFRLITDFGRYAELAEDVHEVVVHPTPEGEPGSSDWKVNFRRGVMSWNERETFEPEQLRIAFQQADGDFDDFRGDWRLTPREDGCEVRFAVTYDFGIPSLSGIMDPIAERVIKRAIRSVLEGLFGGVTILDGAEALTDLDRPLGTEGVPAGAGAH
ncbi:SRPBCC family protein [Streptomyces ficellus]|uniref:SRPBCC family protein n=1 Tax=Streptomyces ficellus TaxID=1977088 RepID=A0ABT7ZC56_9ACTN|nr:SRPBCC family protein [Streptomyces ficellus]MDN3297067.1 SRPBCC family protein [Streptomyces ficellus]